MACGTGGVGAGFALAAGYALLLVFGIALVGVLSLRAARGAFVRMRATRPSTGLSIAQGLTTTLYVLAVAATIISGGLLFALFLLAMP